MSYISKIIPIGNSQGIRIPKPLLEQMASQDKVILWVEDGKLIVGPPENPRQGWDEAYARIAELNEGKGLAPDDFSNKWDEDGWEW